MKTIFNTTFICFMCIAIIGCKKYADDYKSFLDNKEVKYSGKIAKATYNTGNLRAQLVWNPSPDPSITKYVISWNNGASKMEVPATSHNPSDLVKVIVPNLDEYVYTFSVVSYDSDGNKSIATEINNVRVYGATYISTLLNRSVSATEPYTFLQDGTLRLNFNKRDTMNVATTIRYTNILGATEERQLLAVDNAIVIPNYKLGTNIQYRSSYYPEIGAIDAFNAAQFSDFPAIIKITECDKSLFKELRLPTDIASEYGWILPHAWDNIKGQDQGFHTGGSGMPQWFTFDLGQQVQLDNFKLYQREGALYSVGNLKVFEVWGSNNPNPDGTYTSWTKLQTFTSFKPSGLPKGQNTDADRAFAQAGEKFTFPTNITTYRYLRFKVLETWGGENYMHFTEFTFYKRN